MYGLVLIGPPGAGKGTLGEYLQQTHGFKHFSSGDLLRDEVRQESSIGQKIRATLREGGQVEDALITEMIFKKLEEMRDRQQTFVLDGFPQTPTQKQTLDAYIEKCPDLHVRYVCLLVEIGTAHSRMQNRLSCEKCHAVFSKVRFTNWEKAECAECHLPLTCRPSDQGLSATNRLNFFVKTTQPLMDSLLAKKAPLRIDANGSPENVHQQINTIIDTLNQI